MTLYNVAKVQQLRQYWRYGGTIQCHFAVIFTVRDRIRSALTVSDGWVRRLSARQRGWFGPSRDREQHHAGRDREVERVGAPPHGDLDEEVAGRREFVRQALLLIAHQEDKRPRDDRRPIVR